LYNICNALVIVMHCSRYRYSEFCPSSSSRLLPPPPAEWMCSPTGK